MNLDDSYRVLGIGSDSSEEERFKAYGELRERLSSKFENAPTAGLKKRYKEALKRLDEAIESVESNLDNEELPILEASPLNRGKSPIRTENPNTSSAYAPRSRRRLRWLWICLLVSIGIAILVFSNFAWRRHVDNENLRIAAIELERAEQVKKADLASARKEIQPKREPYEQFARRRDSILENAETRRSELETAMGVAEREGTPDEREISRLRFQEFAKFSEWLDEYLEKHSLEEELTKGERLVVEGRLDEAQVVFDKPLPDFEELERAISDAEQRIYEQPIQAFLAKRDFNRALENSRKAMDRLNFRTAIESLKPYEDKEYVGIAAKSELESLYRLKFKNAIERAQHAADIGEFQLSRTILDTIEEDPLSSDNSVKKLSLVERLNSEYAFEEAVAASERAIEMDAHSKAREQLAYLTDDPYVGERAKREIEQIEGLAQAWEMQRAAEEAEAEKARIQVEADIGDDDRAGIGDSYPPPQLLSEVDPVYPDLLRRKGINGFVELEWLIGADGIVRDVVVVASSRYEFEAPAVEAVGQWRFKPVEKDGNPVAVKVRQKVVFSPR